MYVISYYNTAGHKVLNILVSDSLQSQSARIWCLETKQKLHQPIVFVFLPSDTYITQWKFLQMSCFKKIVLVTFKYKSGVV